MWETTESRDRRSHNTRRKRQARDVFAFDIRQQVDPDVDPYAVSRNGHFRGLRSVPLSLGLKDKCLVQVLISPKLYNGGGECKVRTTHRVTMATFINQVEEFSLELSSSMCFYSWIVNTDRKRSIKNPSYCNKVSAHFLWFACLQTRQRPSEHSSVKRKVECTYIKCVCCFVCTL